MLGHVDVDFSQHRTTVFTMLQPSGARHRGARRLSDNVDAAGAAAQQYHDAACWNARAYAQLSNSVATPVSPPLSGDQLVICEPGKFFASTVSSARPHTTHRGEQAPSRTCRGPLHQAAAADGLVCVAHVEQARTLIDSVAAPLVASTGTSLMRPGPGMAALRLSDDENHPPDAAENVNVAPAPQLATLCFDNEQVDQHDNSSTLAAQPPRQSRRCSETDAAHVERRVVTDTQSQPPSAAVAAAGGDRSSSIVFPRNHLDATARGTDAAWSVEQTQCCSRIVGSVRPTNPAAPACSNSPTQTHALVAKPHDAGQLVAAMQRRRPRPRPRTHNLCVAVLRHRPEPLLASKPRLAPSDPQLDVRAEAAHATSDAAQQRSWARNGGGIPSVECQLYSPRRVGVRAMHGQPSIAGRAQTPAEQPRTFGRWAHLLRGIWSGSDDDATTCEAASLRSEDGTSVIGRPRRADWTPPRHNAARRSQRVDGGPEARCNAPHRQGSVDYYGAKAHACSHLMSQQPPAEPRRRPAANRTQRREHWGLDSKALKHHGCLNATAGGECDVRAWLNTLQSASDRCEVIRQPGTPAREYEVACDGGVSTSTSAQGSESHGWLSRACRELQKELHS